MESTVNYIRLADLAYPRHEGDIRIEHPEFDGINVPEGWAHVEETELPELGERQEHREIEPEQIDGVWFRRWTVHQFTQEEWDGIREKAKLNFYD